MQSEDFVEIFDYAWDCGGRGGEGESEVEFESAVEFGSEFALELVGDVYFVAEAVAWARVLVEHVTEAEIAVAVDVD